MRRYTLVSGLFLTLVTCLQLVRLLLQWPVSVAGFSVPLWGSVIAALVAGSMAFWAFRVLARSDSAAAV